jgi:hypothetical protein
MLADSVRFTQVVCEYLEGIGVGLSHDESNEFLTCRDANPCRQDQHQDKFEPTVGLHRSGHAILTERARTHTRTQSSRPFRASAAWRFLDFAPRRSSLEPVTIEEGSRRDP